MAEIIVDHENLTIKIGDRITFDEPIFFPDARRFSFYIASKLQIYDNKKLYIHNDNGDKTIPIKTIHKIVGDYLGCNPRAFFPKFKAQMAILWLEPLPEKVRKGLPYCRFKKYNGYALYWCRKQVELLYKLEKNSMLPIAPFLIGEKPTYNSAVEMRKNVGNSTWKRLLRNTFNHNYLLTCINFESCEKIYPNWSYTKFLYSEYINFFNLKPVMFNFLDETNIEKTAMKYRFVSKYDKLREFRNIFLDTQRMATQNGFNFNRQWSPKRMKEEHDNMVKRINQKKYSKEKISWLVKYPRELTLDNCSARLLESPYDFVVEGNKMGHCVASYSKYCTNGKYIVYHVESKNEQSTIGFDCIDGNINSINQHYGKYNARVMDENHKMMAEHILHRLKNLDCRLEAANIA